MRLIDADELWEKAKVRVEDNGGLSLPNLYWIIKGLPTIEAEPIRHGHWELIDSTEPRRYGCSQCKRMVWHEENYCPNCGAKMDEVTEEEYDEYYAKHRD